jgi:nucleotide-binding universal stress UspA family protein
VTDENATVLLCYDDSDQSKHAITIAGRLFPGAKTHVLNVWEPVERIVARYAALAPFMGEELGEADMSIGEQSAQVAAAGVELARAAGLDAAPRTESLESTVWEAVLAVAENVGADVIVTGTRSLHGVREMISNTLSHHLIQHSPVAVLAIPSPEEDRG